MPPAKAYFSLNPHFASSHTTAQLKPAELPQRFINYKRFLLYSFLLRFCDRCVTTLRATTYFHHDVLLLWKRDLFSRFPQSFCNLEPGNFSETNPRASNTIPTVFALHHCVTTYWTTVATSAPNVFFNNPQSDLTKEYSIDLKEAQRYANITSITLATFFNKSCAPSTISIKKQ